MLLVQERFCHNIIANYYLGLMLLIIRADVVIDIVDKLGSMLLMLIIVIAGNNCVDIFIDADN